MACGASNKEIGVALFISEGTVKTHVKSVLAKLDATSRTEAVGTPRARTITTSWNANFRKRARAIHRLAQCQTRAAPGNHAYRRPWGIPSSPVDRQITSRSPPVSSSARAKRRVDSQSEMPFSTLSGGSSRPGAFPPML